VKEHGQIKSRNYENFKKQMLMGLPAATIYNILYVGHVFNDVEWKQYACTE